MPNTIANTTRRSNRMLECTSATSMKTKYAAAKSMSRSMETQTQLLSRSTPTTLQPMLTSTLKGL